MDKSLRILFQKIFFKKENWRHSSPEKFHGSGVDC